MTPDASPLRQPDPAGRSTHDHTRREPAFRSRLPVCRTGAPHPLHVGADRSSDPARPAAAAVAPGPRDRPFRVYVGGQAGDGQARRRLPRSPAPFGRPALDRRVRRRGHARPRTGAGRRRPAPDRGLDRVDPDGRSDQPVRRLAQGRGAARSRRRRRRPEEGAAALRRARQRRHHRRVRAREARARRGRRRRGHHDDRFRRRVRRGPHDRDGQRGRRQRLLRPRGGRRPGHLRPRVRRPGGACRAEPVGRDPARPRHGAAGVGAERVPRRVGCRRHPGAGRRRVRRGAPAHRLRAGRPEPRDPRSGHGRRGDRAVRLDRRGGRRARAAGPGHGQPRLGRRPGRRRRSTAR